MGGKCFQQLGLEVAEVAVLFELLSSESGQADYHEFLEGALKLKQSARAIDVIQIIHGNSRLARALHKIYKEICEVAIVEGLTVEDEVLSPDCSGNQEAPDFFDDSRRIFAHSGTVADS